MKMFKILEKDTQLEYTAICETKNTRNGFAHVCTLISPETNESIRTQRANYQNRTWESFEYETCLKNLVYQFMGKDNDDLWEIKK